MDRPNRAFYVPPHLWRVVDKFTSGCVCAVLASELYSEEDYIRTYEEFLEYRRTAE